MTLYYMGAFTPAIWSTTAWTEKFNNGLCTHFLRLHRLKSSRNSSRLKNRSCELSLMSSKLCNPFFFKSELSIFPQQLYLWNRKRFQVKSTGAPPGQRHSHSAVAHRDNVVISGGLDERLRPVNTVHVLDVTSLMWTEIVFHNLIPR